MELGIIIEEFVLNYGVISIFIIVALEYAKLSLHSEIVLPLAGILVSEYKMNIILIILVCVIGGVVGSLTNCYLGYCFGNPLIYKLKKKYPKTQKAIKESYRWMEKYEKISVMLSRLVPHARIFISIVAGATRIGVWEFILYSPLCITLWNAILILIGFVIGNNMGQISYILGTYSKVIAVLLVMLFVIYLVVKKKNINRNN